MTFAQQIYRWTGLATCCLLAALALAPTLSRAQDASAPPVVVGRVYDIRGELLRYVPPTKDWVAMVKDAPFGTEDTLYAGSNGKAELILPNRTWIRIGNDTQIQFLDLSDDTTETDVASGVARFYNKSDTAVIKATSDFGYVLADPGSVHDFYVGENSIELIPIRGKLTFVHYDADGGRSSYDLQAGQPSLLADKRQVTSGESLVDPDWDEWNAAREDYWARRSRIGRQSAEYLPVPLRHEAYVLEEYGRWERVRYDGGERLFWRPRHVDRGWSPFTAGRWTEWHGDQVWIPNEPFGYLTHHYGNWVFVGGFWYWAPPVARFRVGAPLLDVGFFWSPGRVCWIHRDDYVGWVPLAPRERYYGHRRWGDRYEVVVSSPGFSVALNIGSFAYSRQAVVIHQRDYWRDRDYRHSRVRDVNHTTIINNYYAAPVVNNTVINNYSTNRERYNYTSAEVREKPHNTVVQRIEQNDENIRRAKREDAKEIKQQVREIPKGRRDREARIEQPKVVDYMVPATEVNRPKSEVKFEQKEIKGRDRTRGERRATPETEAGQRPGAPPEIERERPSGEQPAQPSPAGEVRPPREGRPEKGKIDETARRAEEGRRARGEGERVRPPRDEKGQPAEQTPAEEARSPREERRGGGRPDDEVTPPAEERGKPRPERVRPPREERGRPAEPSPAEEVRPPREERRGGGRPDDEVAPSTEERKSRPERVRPPSEERGRPAEPSPAEEVRQPREERRGGGRPEEVAPPTEERKSRPERVKPPREERGRPAEPSPAEEVRQPREERRGGGRPEEVAPPTEERKPRPERVRPPREERRQEQPGEPSPSRDVERPRGKRVEERPSPPADESAQPDRTEKRKGRPDRPAPEKAGGPGEVTPAPDGSIPSPTPTDEERGRGRGKSKRD